MVENITKPREGTGPLGSEILVHPQTAFNELFTCCAPHQTDLAAPVT